MFCASIHCFISIWILFESDLKTLQLLYVSYSEVIGKNLDILSNAMQFKRKSDQDFNIAGFAKT